MSLDLLTHAPTARRGSERTGSLPFLKARLDTGEAEVRARLLAAFDGLEFADGAARLRAEAAVGPASDHGIEPWLWFDTHMGPVAAIVLRLEGAPAGWPAAETLLSTPAALAAMGRLEFVIQGLEGDGAGWRPVRFGVAEGLSVRLDLKAEDGRLVHRLALCLPQAASAKLPAARPPDLSRLPGAVPLAAVLVVAGPRVPIPQLESLSVGDLVWLAEDVRCQARLRLKGGLRADGLFDPAARQFHSSTPPQSDPGREGETAMSLDADEDQGASAVRAPPSLEDLPLRVSFEFGPWPARLADVARIAPGFVLPAPEGEGELEVRLTVEGRTLARGRLVALGRRYGVLVDSVER